MLAAGGAGAVAMMATLMAIAEIASEPTAVAGVDSSAWTPPTGITSFLFGADAFTASFQPLPILFGLAAHLALSLLFGALGVALVIWLLGYRPAPLGAVLVGLAYGLALEVLVLNLAVNGIQGANTVYESLPQWGWWAAHAAYGTALFLAAAAMLRGARLLGGRERTAAEPATVTTT